MAVVAINLLVSTPLAHLELNLLSQLLVKLDCFEIILFNASNTKFYQKACDLNDGSGCSLLGFMHDKGKGVKQDESNHCQHLNHTPFGKT